jgi:hypothetical protein
MDEDEVNHLHQETLAAFHYDPNLANILTIKAHMSSITHGQSTPWNPTDFSIFKTVHETALSNLNNHIAQDLNTTRNP